MEDRAQSAMFDAFLFFVIALVASAMVLGYTSLTLAQDDRSARAEALAYAEEVRASLMRATLEDPWYRNLGGERVDLGQGVTVERFLVDEIQLLAARFTSDDFTDTNGRILEMAESLVRPPFDVGLAGSVSGPDGTAALWLGEASGPPADRYEASWSYNMIDGSVVRVAVYLWYE